MFLNSLFAGSTPPGLIHWGPVTHICVGNLTIIGSDKGLSPDRRQVITWTNAGILLIAPLGTNFSEIIMKIHIFSFKKMFLKLSSAKRQPFCLGLNVLIKRWVTWLRRLHGQGQVSSVPGNSPMLVDRSDQMFTYTGLYRWTYVPIPSS